MFVLVDIVQHLSEQKLKQLFDLVFKYANKKVVILEPAFVNRESIHGLIGKAVDDFLRFMDYDGFNRIHRWFTNEEYSRLFLERFGSAYGTDFSMHRQEIAQHHLVTFVRSL